MTTQLRINLIVPEPFPGAGGDVGLFRMARYLAEFDHNCQVYVVPYDLMNDFTTDDVRNYVHEHFGETRAVYHKWNGEVHDADCTLATFWPTVQNALSVRNGGRLFYIVQDFEPSFYPDVPVNYEGAENTYRAGLHCITLGLWLAKLLRDRYHAAADHFDFAVDPEIYSPRTVARDQRRRICFYARPTTPRRAYATGVAALERVHAIMPELEIVFFGTAELDPAPQFPCINRRKLDPQQLATLFSSCDVGLVLSLTNPSFVPLEMLACRCPVVDVASERFEGILTHGFDAWLTELEPQAIANGILRLLTDETLRARLVENGYTRTRSMSWRQSARQIEAVLLRNYPGAEHDAPAVAR